MTWQRITFDADRMGGQPCLGHTRITVATVVRCVASGMSTADIQEAYPDLEAQDIAEALSYAAAVTEDRVIPFKPTGS